MTRNEAIGRLLDEKRLSYSVIAEMFGETRNVIAGIAFRRRHPRKTLVPCASDPSKPNKTGKGWQPQSYYPNKTALNTRI